MIKVKRRHCANCGHGEREHFDSADCLIVGCGCKRFREEDFANEEASE